MYITYISYLIMVGNIALMATIETIHVALFCVCLLAYFIIGLWTVE
jgi:hypothetical protein